MLYILYNIVFDVTGVMGDRHGNLGQSNASDLIFCEFSVVSTMCICVCSSIVAHS